MRATMRITWLLLSVSFLCYISGSNGQNSSSPTSILAPVNETMDVTTVNSTTAKQTTATTLPTTISAKAADTGTTPRNGPVSSSPAPTTSSASTIKTTLSPSTGQPRTPTATNKPPEATTISSTTSPPGAAGSGPKATATSSVNIITQGPTTAKSGTPANVPIDKNQPNTVTTITPTPGNQGTSTSQNTFTPTSSQDTNKQGTQQAAVTPTSGGQMKATVTASKTGATIASSVTKMARDSAAPSPGTIARTKSPTTSPIPTSSPSSTSSASQSHTFVYPPPSGAVLNEKDKDLETLCKQLTANLKGPKCKLVWRKDNDKVKFDSVEIAGAVKTEEAAQSYEEITRKPTDNKTLIAILASCGALLIMIVIFAVCASHHRKPYNENQQHLTEELHTVENGYHDNPTLEVMEVQPEMQEKKMALNGEFSDSWIVPIDNLLKEDIPDEEDTHL